MKSAYKIHLTVTQDVIDILNEKANNEPTAGKNAVGSFGPGYMIKAKIK